MSSVGGDAGLGFLCGVGVALALAALVAGLVILGEWAARHRRRVVELAVRRRLETRGYAAIQPRQPWPAPRHPVDTP